MKLSKIAIGLSIFFTIFSANAKIKVPNASDLPVLKEESQHKTACSRTASYFLRAHYKTVNLDKDFSDNVVKQYLSYLDYNKSIFTKAEVDEIYKSDSKILNAIKECKLDYPFELYNLTIQKRFEKYNYFLKQILAGIDVNTNDTIAFDRTKEDFFQTKEEIKKEWDVELKNEYINLILNGKTEKEAKERLTKRYEAFLSRLSQTESEDAFSTFENAFASAIDPHTSYLSPVASDNFNDDINLSLEGIGAVLMADDEYTVINSLVPGSPAELSKKVKAKDRIIGVKQADGTYDDIIGWRLTDVVKKIKGPKGTSVTLDIERVDGANTKNLTVTLVRDKIRLQEREAKGEVKEIDGNKIGVITIKSFYTDLHKDIDKELTKLKKQNIKALVIDLRSNGGGLLPEATASSGLFIGKGPIVLVRDTLTVLPQIDTNKKTSYDGPLVVLINRLSASSSEIMAAALRDYGRALIVGDTSFGKGTVQQNRPLARVYDFDEDKLGSIHYTIAKFYRINGGSTQLKGVVPDITLPSLVDTTQIGERVEENALPWDKIEAAKYKTYLNIDAYIPRLKLKHEDRVKDNVIFKIMEEELQRYKDLRDKKVLSVNLEERRRLKEEEDKIRLENTNIRLKDMNLPLIKNIKDLKDDFEFKDVLLLEAAAIANDFADLQRENIYTDENKSIFYQYKDISSSQDIEKNDKVKSTQNITESK